MIRINLLPHKKGRVSKKQVELRNFLILTGIAAGAVFFLGILAGGIMSSRITSLEAQKQRATAELAELKSRSERIANYESDREVFENKIKVIRQLKKDQSRSVRLLDDIVHHLPERVWLTEMLESGTTLELTGRALSNADIVEMIKSMKLIPMMSNVTLVESRRVQEDTYSSYQFTITGKYGTTALVPGATP